MGKILANFIPVNFTPVDIGHILRAKSQSDG